MASVSQRIAVTTGIRPYARCHAKAGFATLARSWCYLWPFLYLGIVTVGMRQNVRSLTTLMPTIYNNSVRSIWQVTSQGGRLALDFTT
jgi:hypothetical protein